MVPAFAFYRKNIATIRPIRQISQLPKVPNVSCFLRIDYLSRFPLRYKNLTAYHLNFRSSHIPAHEHPTSCLATMVCDGPDPPDNSPQELSPPPRHDLMMNGNNAEESDEENEYFGYEPLPQGPEAMHSDHENSEEETQNMESEQAPTNDVPVIEPMENVLTREVWSAPRPIDPIQMDNERAQQVMSAMANFALPQASIPDWAQSVTEDQWKQTLNDRIERLRSNR